MACIQTQIANCHGPCIAMHWEEFIVWFESKYTCSADLKLAFKSQICGQIACFFVCLVLSVEFFFTFFAPSVKLVSPTHLLLELGWGTRLLQCLAPNLLIDLPACLFVCFITWYSVLFVCFPLPFLLPTSAGLPICGFDLPDCLFLCLSGFLVCLFAWYFLLPTSTSAWLPICGLTWRIVCLFVG